MNPLFLDTSFLIEYIKGRELSNLEVVLTLVREKSVYYNGIVLTELMSGVRSLKEEKKIESMLSGLTYLPTKYADYKQAGQIRRSLFKKGLSMSTPDSLIASHAKSFKLTLVTLDAFFIKGGELIGFPVEIPSK
ncbi:MAG: PIN domain-containing protein [Candidatus Marinimicrobia bacterium]|nr:PIN domain-containing protein [Candidatus Neomarinimicrobiota bacterium]MBL7009766.1 PIN domain-containing protein [Candidatus Neomarinimicrobiota bacterium]MBL7029830.1 PIN domain-containing protein [Candidatus Neomarinimicrobiota bacterium]